MLNRGVYMRLFVAFTFTDGFRAELVKAQRALRRLGVSGGFTRPENLHLTLFFIGETDKAEAVKAALDTLEFEPVRLELEGMGSFGDTIWAGVRLTREFRAAADAVAKALYASGAGFKLEKRSFVPHVTLVRRAKPADMPPYWPDAVSMTADKVSLLSSTVENGRRVYTEIHARRLG